MDMLDPPRGRLSRLLVGALVAIGAVARLAPLLDGSGRLLRQFPTEDGYLMMTIARNMALGRGMSTSAGLIATNGTQPGFTLVEALCFWLTGGQRASGVLVVELLEVAIASLTAWLLYLLGRRVLHGRTWGAGAAALAAAAWYASGNVVPHSMNCLETGCYVLLLLLAVLVWHRFWRRASASPRPLWGGAMGVGLVLAAAFWARIDAVFLIGALIAVHAAWDLRQGWHRVRPRLLEAVTAGLVTLVLAAPWLLYNRLRFGSFMPVSGIAESEVAWFTNTPLLPAALLRYLALVLPLPHDAGTRPGVILFCLVIILLWAGMLVQLFRRANSDERWLFACGVLLLLALSGYYGLRFGAGHFLDRYLFPAAPLIALGNVAALVALTNRVRGQRLVAVGRVVMASLLLALVFGHNARAYAQGRQHMHFQVVEWVGRNIPEATWVAAAQTGTLGFFHDRTINLDGKVNPEALWWRKQNRIPEYIVASRWGKEQANIDYIVDWEGMAGWSALAPIHANFDLVVDDAGLNLAVFRRKSVAAFSLR